MSGYPPFPGLSPLGPSPHTHTQLGDKLFRAAGASPTSAGLGFRPQGSLVTRPDKGHPPVTNEALRPQG